MSLINTEIKPFTATAFHQGAFEVVSEETLKGKWSIVFFYPADFTFVCPTELGDLADNYSEFQKLGVEVYSVSTDTHFTHKAWHDGSETIKKIQYPMIGDPTGQITRNFDVMIEADGLADRGTFVIDPQGVIRFVSVHDLDVGLQRLGAWAKEGPALHEARQHVENWHAERAAKALDKVSTGARVLLAARPPWQKDA